MFQLFVLNLEFQISRYKIWWLIWKYFRIPKIPKQVVIETTHFEKIWRSPHRLAGSLHQYDFYTTQGLTWTIHFVADRSSWFFVLTCDLCRFAIRCSIFTPENMGKISSQPMGWPSYFFEMGCFNVTSSSDFWDSENILGCESCREGWLVSTRTAWHNVHLIQIPTLHLFVSIVFVANMFLIKSNLKSFTTTK